jgi:hypothetical protein
MVIAMGEQPEIPCSKCQFWRKKQKKFSCNPNDCSLLTSWLLENAPQLSKETLQMQVRLPEVALQYVV